MLPEDIYQFISASVIPVVIISACALMSLAFYNRLASIVSRLRNFSRELLREQDKYARQLHKPDSDPQMIRRRLQLIEMIETQSVRVSRRAKLIQWTLLCMLGTIGSLTACSLMLGVSVFWVQAIYAAIPFFIFGMLAMLAGVALAAFEMKAALETTEMESQFVRQFTRTLHEDFDTGVRCPSTPLEK